MEQIMTLLNGVLDARGRVLLKLNVTEKHRDAVLAVLPSMKSPTMSPLAGGGYAVESVVEKKMINLVIPALRRRRCDRSGRDADRQDRAVTELARGTGRRGIVAAFDAEQGLGTVCGDDGIEYPFHCIEIADGTRTIPAGFRGELRRARQARSVGSCQRPFVTDDPRLERERRILDVLMALREGEVTTYGDVADVAGYPKQSRLVGRILSTTDVEVPWWRVVNAIRTDRQRSSGRAACAASQRRRHRRRCRVRNAPLGRFHRRLSPRPKVHVEPPAGDLRTFRVRSVVRAAST